MVQQESAASGLPDLVNILVVGDPGVGKTSLISSLVNGVFYENAPSKLDDVTLKAELCPDNIPIKIVDSSEMALQNRIDDLRTAVKETDAICLVYNAGDDVSLDRIASHWIPTLRRYQSVYAGNYKPIVLVANKIDKMNEEKSLDMVTTIMRDFDDVVFFIEVSAKTLKNVVEVFYSAQKSVIYPLAPLYDPHLRTLTRKCRQALIEIFKLCDMDKDGLLNDYELNRFQEDCFGAPLHTDALEDIKLIIKQSTRDGIVHNSMTQEGFLFLHTLSIDKGRPSFTWQVLRKFNYDNQLEPKIGLERLRIGDDDDEHGSNSSHVAEESTFLLSIDDSKEQTLASGSEMSSSSVMEGERTSAGEHHLSGQLEAWLQDNKRIIKHSVGFTMATLVSMLALKYLVQNVIKTRF